MVKIESLQNPQIKRLIQLIEKSRARKKESAFVIEGERELTLALQANYSIDKIYFCDEFLSQTFKNRIKKNSNSIIELSKDVYQKVAYRNSTEGVLAIAQSKSHSLESIELPQNPIVLVVESIEKPGNLGAMLRTADATQVDAVLIANPISDLYNPNVIRSSVGCVFTNQVAIGTSEEIIQFLNQNNIDIYSAILQNAEPYDIQNFKKPTALVVGSEAKGLSDIWRTLSKQNIIIPMEGVIDSMNVSVAAAVLVFEAKRQRKNSL